MAPSDSAHEDARRAHLCQSVCEISVMIFVDVTYIDTILRFRPNNDRLRDVTARLEKLARLLGKEFNSDTQNNMISLSLEHAPVSMETVFTDANPTAPEYRTAKARFLSQAISYAIELVLFDGSKSGVSVLEERMKQLKIVRGATIMERRMVDFLYPHSVVFPTTERPIYASFYTEIQTKYLNEANKISRLREIISHTLDVLKAEGTPVNKAIDSKGQPDLVATSEAEPTGKSQHSKNQLPSSVIRIFMNDDDSTQSFQISERLLFEHSTFFDTYFSRMLAEKIVTEDVPHEPTIRRCTWYQVLHYCGQSRDISLSIKRQLSVSVNYLRDIPGRMYLIDLWLGWMKNTEQELIINSKLISKDDAIILACFLQTKKEFVDKLDTAKVTSS